MDDMGKAKREYLKGGVSYRALAVKYGIPFKKLAARGKAENWVGLREQTRDKTGTMVADSIAKAKADLASRVYDAASMMLDKAVAVAEKCESAKDVRALTAAIRDIREIAGVRSELDRQEQEARIEKLRREAEQEQQEKPELIIQGLPEEFKA